MLDDYKWLLKNSKRVNFSVNRRIVSHLLSSTSGHILTLNSSVLYPLSSHQRSVLATYMCIAKSWIYLHLYIIKNSCSARLSQIFAPGRKTFFFFHFVPSLPEIMPEGLELSVWGRPACVSRFSLLNNSACLFTCSLLTLKLQPPVTLLLNTLMIMTSALPLAIPSCVKYWESFVNVCVSVSCCVCKTESEWLRLLILCVCER